MKLSQIVYPLTKPNVTFAISIYLKKIFFSNAHRIPTNTPVLFVSNHPTAFLEPVIYAGLFDKPIYSLVRGDFFQNWLARTGLESLNMVEIYRMRDGGVEGLRKNVLTFQYCYDLLAQNKQVLIMAEGFTKQQKRLSPLQKGAARLALGAAQGRKLENLMIVPLGANFTKANEFRGEIMIEVGEPMTIAPYLKEYKSDKPGAIESLTNDIQIAMQKTLVHIEKPEDDSLFEQIVPILRRRLPSTLWPKMNTRPLRFELEKSLSDKLNSWSEKEKKELQALISAYPLKLGLRSNKYFINWMGVISLFPIWTLGLIYRTIPFAIARRIVKDKVEVREFESPIRFGMGSLFFILWSWLMILLTAIIFGIKWILIPMLMPFIVWISIIYEDLLKIIRQGIKWGKISRVDQQKALKIEEQVWNQF